MATGFLVVGPKVIGATDKEQLLVDVIDEQVDTIGKAFLGLTIGCARCHDHKFDPISARDYYALAGILASTETIHGNLLNRRDLTGWNLHPLGPGGQAAYEAFLAHEKAARRPDEGAEGAPGEAGGPEEGSETRRRERRRRGEAGGRTRSQGRARAGSNERLAELKREICEAEEEPRPAPAAGDVGERSGASRPDRDLHPRRCPQPGRDGPSRVRLDRRAADAGDRAGCQRPGAAGRLAHQRAESAHQPRGGEPGLAAPVRAGAGRHAGRLRHAGRAPLEPRPPRPSGPAVHATGLVGEAIDPPAGAQPDLPVELGVRSRGRGAGSREPLALADEPPPAPGRGPARRPAGRERSARPVAGRIGRRGLECPGHGRGGQAEQAGAQRPPDGLSAGGPQRPPAALPALRLRRFPVRERAAEQPRTWRRRRCS